MQSGLIDIAAKRTFERLSLLAIDEGHDDEMVGNIQRECAEFCDASVGGERVALAKPIEEPRERHLAPPRTTASRAFSAASSSIQHGVTSNTNPRKLVLEDSLLPAMAVDDGFQPNTMAGSVLEVDKVLAVNLTSSPTPDIPRDF